MIHEEGVYMARSDGRQLDEIRKVIITKNYNKYAEGSCLIEVGDTRVVCTATIEDSVPPFLKGTMTGWITAEYGMLPRSCKTRIQRDKTSGRTYEIQRLIGRSLRSIIDLTKIGERTIRLDCDVIQADGGTRTASITGSFIALIEALHKLKKAGLFISLPVSDYVAAISVGVIDGKVMLDLTYEEDSNAQVDMNVVMTGNGKFIEVQGTAEREPFSKNKMDDLLELAKTGITKLIEMQKKEVERYISS